MDSVIEVSTGIKAISVTVTQIIKHSLCVKSLNVSCHGTGAYLCLYWAEYQLKQPPPKSNWWPAGGGVKCVLSPVTDKILPY